MTDHFIVPYFFRYSYIRNSLRYSYNIELSINERLKITSIIIEVTKKKLNCHNSSAKHYDFGGSNSLQFIEHVDAKRNFILHIVWI